MNRAMSLFLTAALLGGCIGSAAAEKATADSEPTPREATHRIMIAPKLAPAKAYTTRISMHAGVRIRISPELAEEMVSLTLETDSWEEAISAVSASVGGTWWRETDGSLMVGAQYPGPVISRVFDLQTSETQKLVGALRPLLSSSGSVVPLPGDRSILVIEREKHMWNVANLIARFDSSTKGNRSLNEPRSYLDQTILLACSDCMLVVIAEMLEGQISHRIVLHGDVVERRATVFSRYATLRDLLKDLATDENLVWWEEGPEQISLAEREWYIENRFHGTLVQRSQEVQPSPTPYDRDAARLEILRQHRERLQRYMPNASQ